MANTENRPGSGSIVHPHMFDRSFGFVMGRVSRFLEDVPAELLADRDVAGVGGLLTVIFRGRSRISAAQTRLETASRRLRIHGQSDLQTLSSTNECWHRPGLELG